MSSAARQKRLRERHRRGIVVAKVEVPNELIGFLIDTGWLPLSESEDRCKIGVAIRAAMEDAATRPIGAAKK